MGVPEMEWLLGWEVAAAQPATVHQLIDARPVASPGIRLRLAHSMQAGAWVADECMLAAAWPFAVEAKCPHWTSTLVARCNGHWTSRDHLEFLKESGAVPADAPAAEFVKLIRALIAGAFLEIPDFTLPRTAIGPAGPI